MKIIDGAHGEGGGQILRTSLSLAVMTGQPVNVVSVRARRKKPGLLRQHLCAVKAAATICNGRLSGAEIGSGQVTLTPNAVVPGEYRFSVGTAGSAVLVLQTVLPPLLVAGSPSRVVVEGGTHNPSAPPFEYLDRVFAPALRQMGAGLELALEKVGFYPTGGGRIVAEIRPPAEGWMPIDRTERGAVLKTTGWILSSGVADHVAQREAKTLREKLGSSLAFDRTGIDAYGPGNAVLVDVELDGGRALFAAFGARGKPAESVAEEAAAQVQRFLALDVPVDEHLADQLLLPMAVGAGGTFRTGPLSSHAETNIHVIRQFGVADISVEAGEHARVEVRPRAAAATTAPLGLRAAQ